MQMPMSVLVRGGGGRNNGSGSRNMHAAHRQALLWGLDNDMDAEATAVLLEERGVMRVACLADGTAWALVDPALLQRLQARCWVQIRA